MPDYPPHFLDALRKVTAKRAKTVIDHILQHGHITTEELKDLYGYDHPPRAARDVRECGIPLETFRTKGSHGRSIASYRFGDPKKIERHKLGGRAVFSKELRNTLYARQSGKCGICFQEYPARYLQVDHRVPYEVAGDALADQTDSDAFLLICASCQRSKSWTCEHCRNWTETKDVETCLSCYWARPDSYSHLALQFVRREVLVWIGEDVKRHTELASRAREKGLSFPDYIKQKLANLAE